MSFPRKQPQAFDALRDITEGPVRVLSMAGNGDSASSFTTPDKGLFLCTFVGNSTSIAVMIMTFLVHMSVLAGQGAPVSFSTKFSLNRQQGRSTNRRV